MILDALLKGQKSSGGADRGAQRSRETPDMSMLPDPEAQAKIKKYQDFQDKKLLP